jgi:dTDP-L-rhamnose 4-epimerase
MLADETVLITGGAGFIGCGVANDMIRQGARVVVVDALHPQVHTEPGRPERLPENAELLPFDVTDPVAWDAFLKLERPGTVVHLAAETGTSQSLRESSRHGLANCVGTTQMLDAFTRAEHVPSRIVLTSSRAVYGEGEWEAHGERYRPLVRTHQQLQQARWDPPSPSGAPGRPVRSAAARTPTEPTSVYGATKLAQEHICRSWAAGMGSGLTVLRLQNVYGVGQSLGNPYTGVLSLFTRLALAGEVIPVYEDGNIVRDFVYIDDVVSAVTSAVTDAQTDAGAAYRVADVGSGTPSTIAEVAQAIAQLAGAPQPKITGQYNDGDVRAASCEIDAARRLLGYEARWSLSDGLESLMAWVRAELAGR